MKLPIYSYGHDILRQQCEEITADYPALPALIENMWQTLYAATGCGLAAPQIGKAIQLFLVDSKTTYDHLDKEDRAYYFADGDTGIFETFINAKIIDYSEETWEDEEGCLSIPHISQKVERHWSITVSYMDRDHCQQVKDFSGLTARMIQHEYDHTEGVLYLDYLKPLTKRLIENKLKQISKGKIPVQYQMVYKK